MIQYQWKLTETVGEDFVEEVFSKADFEERLGGHFLEENQGKTI